MGTHADTCMHPHAHTFTQQTIQTALTPSTMDPVSPLEPIEPHVPPPAGAASLATPLSSPDHTSNTSTWKTCERALACMHTYTHARIPRRHTRIQQTIQTHMHPVYTGPHNPTSNRLHLTSLPAATASLATTLSSPDHTSRSQPLSVADEWLKISISGGIMCRSLPAGPLTLPSTHAAAPPSASSTATSAPAAAPGPAATAAAATAACSAAAGVRRRPRGRGRSGDAKLRERTQERAQKKCDREEKLGGRCWARRAW